jgi:hypothetical protein
MTSPDWEQIAEKYVAPDLENNTKDLGRYFGPNAKNNLHNDVFNSLKDKRKKGDLHRYALVKNYSKLLPGIQKRLIADKKIIQYQHNGKTIYRNNVPWSNEETQRLRELSSMKQSNETIAKTLGRSKKSVIRKRQHLKI